ncbi:hypothetical protein BH09ACT7_BH09ACT7_25860 [soil metagenome]
MPSSELPYPLFDADNHLYETTEALTKYLPEKYRNAIQYVEVDGRTKIAVRGQISEYIPNPTFDVVARPGALEDYFKSGNPEGKSRRDIFGKPIPSIPAFREPGPRLELMNELGIARTLMFPTLASLVEERMRDEPELIHAVVHALNEWLYETWSFNYQDRIFTVPVISLPIVDKAIAELEWCVVRGAKAILIRPAPVPGYKGSRSFALPEFDPFWKCSGSGSSNSMCWSPCTPPTAAIRSTPPTGRAAAPRHCRSGPISSGWSPAGGTSRTQYPPGSAMARCSGSPT